MARISLLTLSITLLFSLNGSLATARPATANPAANFIRTSCHATTYPTVCVESLWSHASIIQTNPKQLVMTALSVSIDRAQSTKTFISSILTKSKFERAKPHRQGPPKVNGAIRDCLEEVSDSVDRLSKSVKELKSMGRARGPEYTWHMSNLQTWVSAALTDDNTCFDGLSSGPGGVKDLIRARMSNVAQVTSNALALCNRFAGKY